MINPKMIVMLLAMVCFILDGCGLGRAQSIGLALLTLGLLL